MDRIQQSEAIGNLPAVELAATLSRFMEPVVAHLPEKRLRDVGELAVQGILGGQSPLVTQMARGVVREEETVWPMAKRLYRFMWNPRFSHRDLLKGLYGIAQRAVTEHAPSHLVGGVGPRQFREALHPGLGKRLYGAEKYTAWSERGEAADVWLSRHNGDSCELTRGNHQLCQLVLLQGC